MAAPVPEFMDIDTVPLQMNTIIYQWWHIML
jgi:hypothetical protein